MLEMLLVAIAPAIALLGFIYQKDRFDREPPSLLLKLFVFGILSVIPVYFIERYLIGLGGVSPLFQGFIVAGITEETVKFLIVYKEAYFSKFYNEKLDGIVYCVFTSLGFATAENIMYVFSGGSNYIYTSLVRAVFSVPAHMLFAITMGYYLSLAKFSKGFFKTKAFLLKALIVSILLHGTYDYILISKVYGFMPIFILFVIYLWRINLRRLNSYVTESKEYYGK